jgi:oligopeptide/dipeptide ABC transporter ATP-binding protein
VSADVSDVANSVAPPSPPLLAIDDLCVEFSTHRGRFQAVRGVSLSIEPGETVALVGESGSGKSVTTRAVLGLVDAPGRVTGGDIRFQGRSVLHGPGAEQYAATVRGRSIGVVFQDPMTSLNPLIRVGKQLTEVLTHHLGMSRRDARARAADLLGLVGITSPVARLRQYPHELSGGMRQRVLIAMALACEPQLLIADEPTTALDVTTQAQILELLAAVQQRMQLSVLLITHDLSVVANLCHRVEVMYGGRMMERAPVRDLFSRPAHPYTAGLLRSTPRHDQRGGALWSIAGSPPDPRQPPSGCPFHPRCALAVDRCRAEMPGFDEVGDDRRTACWRPFETDALVAPAVTADG